MGGCWKSTILVSGLCAALCVALTRYCLILLLHELLQIIFQVIYRNYFKKREKKHQQHFLVLSSIFLGSSLNLIKPFWWGKFYFLAVPAWIYILEFVHPQRMSLYQSGTSLRKLMLLLLLLLLLLPLNNTKTVKQLYPVSMYIDNIVNFHLKMKCLQCKN